MIPISILFDASKDGRQIAPNKARQINSRGGCVWFAHSGSNVFRFVAGPRLPLLCLRFVVRPTSRALPVKDKEPKPTFEDARATLSSLRGRSPYDDGTDIMQVVEALDLFTREINSHPEVPTEELLHLLDFGGLIAEFAARCLYLRTCRDNLLWRPAGSDGIRFIIERADWEAYLAAHPATHSSDQSSS